jgi:hypothetical protein
MASAPSTERPVVLRRLGIIKDPDDAPLQNSRAAREPQQDALELFATESDHSPRVGRWLSAVGANAAAVARHAWRNPIVGLVVVAVLAFGMSVWGINRYFGADGAPTQQNDGAASSGAAEDAPSTDVAAKVATNSSKRPAPANANAAAGARNTSRGQQVALRTEREDTAVATATASVNTPAADVLTTGAPVTAASAPVDASSVADAASTIADDTIYSRRDPDVVPPHAAELPPAPTFSSWTTRTNEIEVIVSETGAVERVRMVTPPQRMPDVLVLSRAKMWKFTPAMKEGKPVRYRLRLTWEVNP